MSVLLSLVCLAVATSSCHDSLPAVPSEPEPALLSPRYSYTCGFWSPQDPPAGRTLVDFFTTSDGTGLRPSLESLEAIASIDGRVEHIYHVPIVRALVDPLRAATLVGLRNGHFVASHVETVTDRTRFEVMVIVVLDHRPTDSDIDAAEALGATIKHRWEYVLWGYSAVVEDAQIPAMRELPGVAWLERDSFGCLDEVRWP